MLQVCGTGKVKSIDVKKRQDVKQLCEALQDGNSVWLEQPSFSSAFDIANGVMPVVLITSITSCHACESELKTNCRPSTISVYTLSGRQCGHSYHKKCTECGLSYYYSYVRKGDGKRTFNRDADSKPFFMISCKTAFSDSYVKLCAVQVEISTISFESVCNQYEALTGDSIDKQRLEEMFFLNRLIQIFREFDNSVVVTTDDESCRKDIESLCKEAVDNMVTLNTLAEDHACDVPGCREGFIMADGVEKVRQGYKAVELGIIAGFSRWST